MNQTTRAGRPRSAALAILAGFALSLVAVATPAQAATPGTIQDLQAALDNASTDSTIILRNDIFEPGWSLSVRSTAHLDLNGFTLETGESGIAAGMVFTIDDSSPAKTGTWNVRGGPQRNPAISTSGATFVVNGGTINATTFEPWAAAIGGAYGEGGGTIIINGGWVTARATDSSAGIGEGTENYSYPTSVTINGGEVTAIGGQDQGAGIGGALVSQGPGAVVTITGGIVNAIGGVDGAGIGGGMLSESYSVVITGGIVNAKSTGGGAGIGGGNGSTAGNVLISGGVVNASSTSGAGIGSGEAPQHSAATDEAVEITGGTVIASSSSGAGIGGGYGSHIASVTIGEGASVTASASGSAVGGGADSSGFGDVTIGGELTIPAGSNLTIPASASVTVTETGVITGIGSIAGTGSIINKGIILSTDVADLADGAGLTITDHNYKIGFNENYSGSAPIDAVRVYAKTFDDGARTVPTPTRSGYVVTRWDTATDGSGSAVTASSTLAADATLYAQWTDDIYTLSPAAASVTAGDTQQFTVDKAIDFGSEDVSAEYSYASSEASDTTEGPGLFGFTRAGERTITATRIADTTITEVTTLTVEPAAAATLGMTPSVSSVDQGGSLTIALELLDSYGNSIPTGQVIITSDHPSDVVDGSRVTFPSASTHILTARYGGLSAAVSITVIPAAAQSGNLSSTGADAGLPLAFAGLLLMLGLGATAIRVAERSRTVQPAE